MTEDQETQADQIQQTLWSAEPLLT
jgi:hypothetical protein